VKEVRDILESPPEDFYSYLHKGYQVRVKEHGLSVETCGIINAKSGKCPSDCKFCAQSVKFKVKIKSYPLIPKDELKKKAKEAFNLGIDRFSFVTSGISINKEELKELGEVIEELKIENPKAKLCASLGQLSKEDLKFLKECGLDRYHHNLETSREFYSKITTKQR
jgi:biotin synthase